MKVDEVYCMAKQMLVYEYECMRLNGKWVKWMKLDGIGWNWMNIDESG